MPNIDTTDLQDAIGSGEPWISHTVQAFSIEHCCRIPDPLGDIRSKVKDSSDRFGDSAVIRVVSIGGSASRMSGH
jgi:hypothetical protein